MSANTEQPMTENQKLREALQDAATSLETISNLLAGKSVHPNGDLTGTGTFVDVRGYATSRASVARQALALPTAAPACEREALQAHWSSMWTTTNACSSRSISANTRCKMAKTIPTWLDIHPREYKKPTIVRFRVSDSPFSGGPKSQILFAIVGTDYGYLHTTGGDLRTWKSYSGAYRILKQYTGA